MNILCYSSYSLPYRSGLTFYVHRLLTHLSKKNRCTSLSFFPSPQDSQIHRAFSYKTKHLSSLFRIDKGFVSPQSLITFFSLLRKNDVVIVFFPNIEAIPLLFLAFMLKKPVITVYLCSVNSKSYLRNLCIKPFLFISLTIHALISKHIVNIPETEQTEPLLSLFHHKLTYAFPPVSTQEHNNKLLFMKNNKVDQYLIGFAGRIAEEKGIEYLIMALKDIMLPCTLLLACPSITVGEEQYKKTILKLLQVNKIHYRIYSDLSDSELSSFLAHIDILVLPSINSTEAFGMVQIEAMYQNTPVIASDLPGMRIPIQKTGMGLLVKPKKPDEIQKAIIAILTQPKKYRKKSKELDVFNPNKAFATFNNLLDSLT